MSICIILLILDFDTVKCALCSDIGITVTEFELDFGFIL